jgi:hypothetical protein
MNANDFTFGIELETTIPAGTVNVGAYHVGSQVLGLPTGWRAMSDGSISAPAGRVGCEFVSPVLKGSEGIGQVIFVVKKLKEMGAAVNASTGFHIHVGWNGDDKALRRLVTLVSNFEDAIFASTGTPNRRNGRWCQSVRRLGSVEAANSVGRYQVLNLTNLRPGGKRTVEFRAFAGTLNLVKILGYIRLCVGLCEKAHKAKRTTKWVAKPTKETSPVHRNGVGQTALTRLYYDLGWTKGRNNYTFGDLTAPGAPDPKTIKREQMAGKTCSQVVGGRCSAGERICNQPRVHRRERWSNRVGGRCFGGERVCHQPAAHRGAQRSERLDGRRCAAGA